MVTSLSINTGRLGRFGNQLFTIAGCIGIAIKNGHEFGFPEWINQDNKLFGGNADKMSDYFVNPLPPIPDVHWHEIGYKWEFELPNLGNHNYDIFRHLQSPKYFEHCIDVVRHFFTLKDEPEQNNYCAIHYRAGDYIDNPDAFHPRCSLDYYTKAMEHFSDEQQFVVFSDDIEKAMELFGGLVKRINYVTEKDYIKNFAYMKKCKHFIIANSSFSAMAALLANHPEKKVVAPLRWFGTEGRGWETKDIYHESWIKI